LQLFPSHDLAGVRYLVERLEPTSDVGQLPFTHNISNYREVYVEVIANANQVGATLDLEVRQSGGTWRTIARSAESTGLPETTISALFMVANVNNTDGSNVRRGHCLASSAGGGAAFDRSNNTALLSNEAVHYSGYTSYNENIAQVRINCSLGNITGGTADQRAIASLYVVDEPTRETSI
jgi:hypothetical protein